MKPTVRKVKNARGRVTGYTAAIGPVSADGITAVEATHRCDDAAAAALARLERGARVFTWRDH